MVFQRTGQNFAQASLISLCSFHKETRNYSKGPVQKIALVHDCAISIRANYLWMISQSQGTCRRVHFWASRFGRCCSKFSIFYSIVSGNWCFSRQRDYRGLCYCLLLEETYLFIKNEFILYWGQQTTLFIEQRRQVIAVETLFWEILKRTCIQMENLKLLFFTKFRCASDDIFLKFLWSRLNFPQHH